jgi:signal transduction histidine kinase
MSMQNELHLQSAPANVINVLLVDDNPNNLLALEETLKSLGPNLVRAGSGDEALKEILKRDFSLILLDVQMPDMDGFETAALIRRREKARHVPIVFLTAGGREEAQIFKGYSLGAVDYLYKPIVPEILKAKVRAFMDLFEKTEQVKRQEELLREAQRREHEREIVQAKQQWEAERLRQEMETEKRAALALAQKADELARTIAERELIEAQLRQSQKLEGIGQLAGGIAHDFNNLLTVILGRAELLKRKLEGDSPLQRDVDLIHKTTERAAGLTRQLLAFSRKQLLQPRVLDLNTVVADMEKMLHRLIGENIELVNVPERALGRVKVDPSQVEQVILNLAVNARDAMPDGGKLLIETGNVVLDESYSRQHVSAQPGRYVVLSVTDTGCGMDAQTQSRIFEPFFTTKEQGKGTGLGLSTVYGIVKQSGGNIWVYSEVGHGSAFKIYFPRVDEVADTLSEDQEKRRSTKGSETILLVEDEDAVRELSEEILREEGYRVLVASNGEEAVAVCRRHEGSIDLVITDVVMPKMSGPELARRLGTFRPGTKTLFLSGYTNTSITQNDLLRPGVEFLQKPFSSEIFMRKVRQILDGASAT